MKKKLMIFAFVLFFIPILVFANEKNNLNLYLFYGKECPHCESLMNYLDSYIGDKSNIKLYKYEVWHDKENLKKFEEVHKIMIDSNNGVPYLIIGNTAISGYSEKLTPDRINSSIEYYSYIKFEDKVGMYLGVISENDDIDKNNNLTNNMDVPIFGKKDVRKFPILLSTIVIGLTYGVNLKNLWILLFLLSMMLIVDNKKKKCFFGITYLFVCGLICFLFLLSWLNLDSILGDIIYIRTFVATVVMILGFSSILKFVNQKYDSFKEVNSENKKNILFVRRIFNGKNYVITLVGITILTIAINVINLPYSLSLPVMFSEIIEINNVSSTLKVFYSIIYVLSFLLVDFIVFLIVMKTTENKNILNKYGKFFCLIGGIIMVIISTLLIFKPNWLMFIF